MSKPAAALLVPTPLHDPAIPAGGAGAVAAAADHAATCQELDSTRRLLDVLTQELAAARAVTRATLESTADAVLVTDPRGRVTLFNEKFLALWGLERADVEGARHADLVRLAAPRLRDAQAVARRVATLHAAAGDDALGETSDLLETRDGQVLERCSQVRRLDGREVGLVWRYRDVTAQVRSEDALRDEAGVLHFLNRIGATIAATPDLSTLLQTAIDAATEVSGAAFGAFFYRDDMGAMPGADGDAGTRGGVPMLALAGVSQPAPDEFGSLRTAALFGAAWGEGRTVRCDDVTAAARYGATASDFGVGVGDGDGDGDGEAPVRSFLAVPVTLRSGATVGGLFFGHPAIGVFSERTERIVVGIAAHAAIALDNARLVEGMRRVALEREQLVEAERAARADSVRTAHIKEEFLSTLSHELRTPLTAILGWAKVLLLDRADAPTRQRGLEAIARNAGAQAALIEELLDMSRIVSGKIALEPHPTDLGRVVDAAIGTVRDGAARKRITIGRRVDPAASEIHGDAARLQQVVANLLSNAVKFTPEGGRVEVELALAADAPGQVELVVSDTGSGIEPRFLPHVFDHFRQADSSITRCHGGLGLGLAIVRQLVGLHGGAVSARSGGIGQGASFVVRLPIDARLSAADASPVAAPARGPADAARDGFADVDLRGLHLLVVDDDTDARELIAQLLVECGADVSQAGSAAAALHEFERQRPDVLLSDIGMPERDGYQLIRDIRSFDAAQGGNVPAVALTAFARSEDRARAMLAGYQAHIAKPIQPSELVATVAGLAQRRRAA